MSLPEYRSVDTVAFTPDQFREAGKRILGARDLAVRRQDAKTVIEELLKAEMAGYSSHGFSRLSRYVEYILEGAINPKAQIEVAWTAKAGGAIVNGNNHFGQVVMRTVVDTALEGIERSAVFAVVARGCNHVGRLASYLERAAQMGYIARAEANVVGCPRVSPHGGVRPRLGTEPFGIAVPTGNESPIVYDASTASIVEGKCNIMRMEGTTAQDGYFIDRDGKATTDPGVVYLEDNCKGSILPMGGLAQGYRGSGHAVLINCLAGILSGTGSNPDLVAPGTNGIWFQLTDVAVFLPLDEFVDRVREFIAYVKTSLPRDPTAPVLIPGEGSRIRTNEAQSTGMRLPLPVWKDTENTARRIGVSLDGIL